MERKTTYQSPLMTCIEALPQNEIVCESPVAGEINDLDYVEYDTL